MRNTVFLASLLAGASLLAAPAFAQSSYNQTLNEQMNRIQASGTPAPAPQQRAATLPAPTQQFAQAEMSTPVYDSAIPALPVDVMTSSNGIRYISGGISDETREELKYKESQFNIKVLLTEESGAFISDATVNLIDASGNSILQVANSGPYFYAAVPAGTYTVEATQGGVSKKATLNAKSSGTAKTHLRFPG